VSYPTDPSRLQRTRFVPRTRSLSPSRHLGPHLNLLLLYHTCDPSISACQRSGSTLPLSRHTTGHEPPPQPYSSVGPHCQHYDHRLRRCREIESTPPLLHGPPRKPVHATSSAHGSSSDTSRGSPSLSSCVTVASAARCGSRSPRVLRTSTEVVPPRGLIVVRFYRNVALLVLQATCTIQLRDSIREKLLTLLVPLSPPPPPRSSS